MPAAGCLHWCLARSWPPGTRAVGGQRHELRASEQALRLLHLPELPLVLGHKLRTGEMRRHVSPRARARLNAGKAAVLSQTQHLAIVCGGVSRLGGFLHFGLCFYCTRFDAYVLFKQHEFCICVM